MSKKSEKLPAILSDRSGVKSEMKNKKSEQSELPVLSDHSKRDKSLLSEIS